MIVRHDAAYGFLTFRIYRTINYCLPINYRVTLDMAISARSFIKARPTLAFQEFSRIFYPVISTMPTSSNAAPNAMLQAELTAAIRRYRSAHPRSASQVELASTLMPGGNTRTSLWVDPFPLTMESGEGCYLRDIDGLRYLDLLGEFTAGIAGHSPAPVIKAIRNALDIGVNLSSHNLFEARLAELLRRRFTSMDLLRFTNSGTEANLMALIAAQNFTQRKKVLAFGGAYHGGVLSFGATEPSRANVPFDYVITPYNDIDAVAQAFRSHGDSIAAVIVEPMQGANGCVPGTPPFLEYLRKQTERIGALLIFDEIQTSRLAYGGRQQVLGIRPDMTTVGKFFGGSLAFGCFGGRREVMEQFDPRSANALGHAGTFNNNTLAMAAGAEMSETLLTEQALGSLNRRGDTLREAMNSIFSSSNAPYVVSGIGSLMNIHPTADKSQAADLRKLIYLDLLESGIYIAARGLIALSLPVGEAECDKMLTAISRFCIDRKDLFNTLRPIVVV